MRAWTIGVLLVLGCAGPVSESEAPWGAGGKADSASRRAFVFSELAAWNEGVGEEALASKYEKMAASAFVFYRGTNHLFWSDTSGDPRLSGLTASTWLQGDLHAENFGIFHDARGELVYDLNDFDEAVVGNPQLDLWRMATSIVLVARNNELDREDAQTAVEAFTRTWIATVEGHALGDDAEPVTEDLAYGRLDELFEEVRAEESRVAMLEKWTAEDETGARVLDVEYSKLAEVDDDTRDEVVAAVEAYARRLTDGSDPDDRFRVKSVAQRLGAGTGSLGTMRFYVLVEGSSEAWGDDVILDVKNQGTPTPWRFLGADERDRQSELLAGDEARRTTVGLRAMLAHEDPYAGWLAFGDSEYSVRERSPWKESFPYEELDSGTRLRKLSEQWGAIVAAAHCRADDDYDAAFVPASFEVATMEQLGDGDAFVATVVEVAFEYASQVEEDYGYFLEMLAEGETEEVPVESAE